MFMFAALYIRSGDILIMSGQSRTAFHAVPRIIKVGDENEPPPCLKWQNGLFDDKTNKTTGVNLDELNVRDKNTAILDKNCASTNILGENDTESNKCAVEELCNYKICSESGHFSFEANKSCGCNKLDFGAKSTRMKSLNAEEWKKFEVYMSKTRININVRQVHEQGKTMNSFCQ